MGVIMCARYEKMVDLDWNAEEVITVGGTEMICWTCATDEEQEQWEADNG